MGKIILPFKSAPAPASPFSGRYTFQLWENPPVPPLTLEDVLWLTVSWNVMGQLYRRLRVKSQPLQEDDLPALYRAAIVAVWQLRPALVDAVAKPPRESLLIVPVHVLIASGPEQHEHFERRLAAWDRDIRAKAVEDKPPTEPRLIEVRRAWSRVAPVLAACFGLLGKHLFPSVLKNVRQRIRSKLKQVPPEDKQLEPFVIDAINQFWGGAQRARNWFIGTSGKTAGRLIPNVHDIADIAFRAWKKARIQEKSLDKALPSGEGRWGDVIAAPDAATETENERTTREKKSVLAALIAVSAADHEDALESFIRDWESCGPANRAALDHLLFGIHHSRRGTGRHSYSVRRLCEKYCIRSEKSVRCAETRLNRALEDLRRRIAG